MIVKLKIFMALHIFCTFSCSLLIFFIIIFYSPAFSNFNKLIFHSIEISLFILIAPLIFIDVCMNLFSDKVVVSFLKKLKTQSHKHPGNENNMVSIVRKLMYSQPLFFIAYPYSVGEDIENLKIIANENDLLFIKKGLKNKTTFNKIRSFHYWYWCVFLFILWHYYDKVPIEFLFQLSFPVIIIVIINEVFIATNYPYRTLIKLAKKYNITKW